jgi:hypothetical protein
LSTFWPSAGEAEITRPFSTVSEFSDRCSDLSPALVKRPIADLTVSPVTCGTAT